MNEKTDPNYTAYYTLNSIESSLSFTSSVQLENKNEKEFYSEDTEMLLFRNAYTVISCFNKDKGNKGIVNIGRIVRND